MFLLCRLQRRTTWQLPTSEPPRSSFCTPRSEQSPSAWLVPFSPSTPGPGTPSWSSSSSSTSLSPSRCSNFPCPTPCWPPSRRCWRRPSTRLTRRLTFSFIFFYLFSENHVQVHIAFIANFHILNSVTTTAMIAVCALVQFLTADLHFEWNRVYVQMLSAVKIQKMFSFWSIFWPKQGARNASCTISRRTKCIGAKFFSRTIPFICLSQMLNVNKLVSEAQSEHACLRSSMTTRLSQIFNDNTLVSGEVDKFLGNHEPDENRSLPCCFCRLLDALSRGTCLSYMSASVAS